MTPQVKVGTVCLGESFFEWDPLSDDQYHTKTTKYPATTTGTDGDSIEVPGFCPNPSAQRGDLVLCRTNAPLATLAYSLIRAQTPCKIQGRDIGVGLASRIKQLVRSDTASTVELISKTEAWATREKAKISASAGNSSSRVEVQLQALQDKVDCILALCEGVETVAEVLSRITVLFQDVNSKTSDASQFVLLSSIHRAKGLESKVVRIIEPKLMPHPMAKTPEAKEQEMNLKYVALTRSLDVLHMH